MLGLLVVPVALLIWPITEILTYSRTFLLSWCRRENIMRIYGRGKTVTRLLVVKLILVGRIKRLIWLQLTCLESWALNSFRSAHHIIESVVLLKYDIIFLRIWLIWGNYLEWRGTLRVSGWVDSILLVVGPIVRICYGFALHCFIIGITHEKCVSFHIFLWCWLRAEKVLSSRSMMHEVLIYLIN